MVLIRVEYRGYCIPLWRIVLIKVRTLIRLRLVIWNFFLRRRSRGFLFLIRRTAINKLQAFFLLVAETTLLVAVASFYPRNAFTIDRCRLCRMICRMR